MKKLFLMVFLSVLLAGCKVEILANVNFSDVMNPTPKKVESNLVVDVVSCNDYEDSRQESSSLIEVKSYVSSIFNEARYIECYREQMDSKALFSVPLIVGGGKDKFGDIQITSLNEKAIRIQVSDSFIAKVNSAKNRSFMDLVPSLSFNLKNDTKYVLKSELYGVFINNNGYSYITGNINQGLAPNITLSNASMDQLFKDKSAIVGIFTKGQ